MARIVTSGAEITAGGSDSTCPDGQSVGTVTRDTGTFRSGLASFKCAGVSGSSHYKAWNWTAPASGTTQYIRGYLNFSAFPTNTITVIQFFGLVAGKITSGGLLQLWNLTGTPAQIGSSSSALSTGTWYRIELSCLIAAGAADAVELRLDGATVASQSGFSLSDTVPGEMELGVFQDPGSSLNVFVDDVALNDSTGGDQNTWPGAGNIVLLKPTADSAVAAGWTDDAGSGTNIFDAVANTPPQGIADTTSSTGLHQIRDATTGANEAYDATMTDYTTAGVPSGATVNVVDPVISTAAPVSTSAKVGQVGVVSNPAIAVINLTGNSGQFWSGTPAGTYETGWKWSHGTRTYAPTVTLGTAPVMRVTQVTSSTRIAMVCLMGIYVDYTPAVSSFIAAPLESRLQAVARASLW